MKYGILVIVCCLWSHVAQAGKLWHGPDGTLPSLDKHDVIFLGELTAITRTNDCEPNRRCRFDYNFRVLKTYKGKLADSVVMRMSQYSGLFMVRSIESERATYLMYGNYGNAKPDRLLYFDRTGESPSFIYTRVLIQDWGTFLPSFEDLIEFWKTGLGRWVEIWSPRITEPEKLVHISRDEVLRVLVHHRIQFIRCYVRGNAIPRFTVHISVSGDGKVKTVKPVALKKEQKSPEDTQSETCLIETIKAWEFPHSSLRDAEFIYTFEQAR